MTFPSHNIDPKKKDEAWHLQFCKAAWNECADYKTMFYHYAKEYDRIKHYAYGRQETSKYKKAMHVDEASNTTYAVLDFRILPIVKKHRQIALGRLQKTDYQIIATPIDPLAKDEADQFFAEMQAKILLREQLKKLSPELAEAPQLKAGAGEPLDEEELQMVREFGFKHTYAKEAEQGIQLIFSQNNMKELRHKIKENLFDDGVCVVKDWMEPGGKIKLRVCDNRSIIANRCRYADFRDLQYMGEVITVTWTQFMVMYAEAKAKRGEGVTEQDWETLYGIAKNKNGWSKGAKYNDREAGQNTLSILDLYWFSVDEQVYEDNKTRLGNPVFVKASHDIEKKAVYNKERFKKVPLQTVYHAMWVVDTDYIFDWGKAPYQKVKGYTNAELPFHVYATNFHDMRASGVMEDIIPIADQMAIAWLKLQNIRNELMPYFIEIDLDALEDVSLGKGGEPMKPKDLIQMMFQNGVLISRKSGLGNNSQNYEAIMFHQTNYGTAIVEAWNDFMNHLQLLRDATGFNEATDGSTVNAKNLNSTNQAMQESTNNALYHIQHAEEELLLSMAYAVLCRLKRAVKEGKVEGYIHALGKGTMELIKVSPDIDAHEYGLMLENKPTAEQKQFLLQLMAKGMQDGILDATDMILIENCSNLKQAEQLLAYRIKKRTMEKQQQALELQQKNAEVQIQSNQVAEQEKRATMQLEYDLKLRNELAIKEAEKELEAMKLGAKEKMNSDSLASKEKQAGVTPPAPETPLPGNAIDVQDFEVAA